MNKNTTKFLEKLRLDNKYGFKIESDYKNIIVPSSIDELFNLSLGEHNYDSFDVQYDIQNFGIVKEASVVKCKNGISVNFCESYMRRRDPDALLIGDNLPTDKQLYKSKYGVDFQQTKQETFNWLNTQEKLIIVPFLSGNNSNGLGYDSIAVAPVNSAFFVCALAELQGFIPCDEIPDTFNPKAVLYVAPPFRHTHFNGKQVVVHNRSENLHEIFAYNLYPGPSAKKGVYAVLSSVGEKENSVTLHASSVKVCYNKNETITFMHEGASGAGKSEMLEYLESERDGKFLLGKNTITNESVYMYNSNYIQLFPATDDMAFSHPKLQNGSKKLVISDAENSWFVRVNEIHKYGTQPVLESHTINTKKPLIFFNIDAAPNSTALIWEHIRDEDGTPCSNPRVVLDRNIFENTINENLEIDIRSFGFRQPQCSKNSPEYGVVGMLHILPPALAWLWRLVSPRGFNNPSITGSSSMASEGVGSYWPFMTGKMVTQANLLLEQILNTPETKYILVPNQNIGVYEVGFNSQQCVRDSFIQNIELYNNSDNLLTSRCSLLGYVPKNIYIDGNKVPKELLFVYEQKEVGNAAYDIGSKKLIAFFKEEISKYLTDDLHPLGRKIIELCLNDADVDDYNNILENN